MSFPLWSHEDDEDDEDYVPPGGEDDDDYDIDAEMEADELIELASASPPPATGPTTRSAAAASGGLGGTSVGLGGLQRESPLSVSCTRWRIA